MRKNSRPQLIEFKGTTVPVVAVTLRSLNVEDLAHTATDLFGDSDFFDGDASTAAFGSFIIPASPNSRAPPMAHKELSPSQSRRGTGSGSRRERGVLADVVIECSSSF